MEELVSEKHFRLLRQRDDLKKEIAMNIKRIEYYSLKLEDLKDEKEDINRRIRWYKYGRLADFIGGSGPLDLVEDTISEYFYKKRLEKYRARRQEILKEMANLCKKRKKKRKINALLKLELVKVREELKNL